MAKLNVPGSSKVDGPNVDDGKREADWFDFAMHAPSDIVRAEAERKSIEALTEMQRETTRSEETKLKREMLKKGRTDFDPAICAPRELVGRSMSSVVARAIDYLWTGWLPRKYITLVVGETGAGKSTALADIVAKVTTGAPWPGETEVRASGRVLWLGSEDGTEDMAVPRLMACGANLQRVIEIQGVNQGGKRSTFSMQDDLEQVRKWLSFARDEEKDPFVLLVIDPITSYLPGNRLRRVDTNDSGQFRSIIEPWFEIAQSFNLAIASVSHFNKDTGRSMLHRVIGTSAFVQTCRSLMAFVDRPADDHAYSKVLVQVKTNLPDHPGAGWRFHTEKIQIGVDPDNQKPIHATRPVWDTADPDLTPESLVGGERGPLSEYAEKFAPWLRNHFASFGWRALPTSAVLAAAIKAEVASRNWWNEHSARYLQKRNINGTWMCYPRVPN